MSYVQTIYALIPTDFLTNVHPLRLGRRWVGGRYLMMETRARLSQKVQSELLHRLWEPPSQPQNLSAEGLHQKWPQRGDSPAGFHWGRDGPVKLWTIIVLVNLKSPCIRKLWG